MNKIKKYLICSILIVLGSCLTSCFLYSLNAKNKTCPLGLIPTPQKVQIGKGHFNLSKPYHIIFSENLKNKEDVAMNIYFSKLFSENLFDQSKTATNSQSSKNTNTIYFELTLSKNNIQEQNYNNGKDKIKKCNDCNKLENKDESYEINIQKNEIHIKAASSVGFIRAGQTMSQLYHNTKSDKLPVCKIIDKPKYAWRGCMLDVSRHIFPMDFIKKQVDILASFKINKLHMHLTDAGGWRMEIDKYPRLISHTAWRTASDWKEWWGENDRTYLVKKNIKIGNKTEDSNNKNAIAWSPEQLEELEINKSKFAGTIDRTIGYGGYYTKEELKELVEYAAKRGITVIPEIEMPGHSEEVLFAYPELGCHYKAGTTVPERNNSSDYCPGNEGVYSFLENVLLEVMEVFPSEYIHIGGDEAGMRAWKNCPMCKRKMEELGLEENNFKGLQAYMITRMGNFLNKHGRQLIGWDEIIYDDLAPNTTVMVWRSRKYAKNAIKKGYDVIITPTEHCYLDYYQDKPEKEPTAIGGYLPFKFTCQLNPEFNLTKEEYKYVKGVQGNLWTEYVQTPAHLEYMLYPRMIGIAEIGWNGNMWQNSDEDSNEDSNIVESENEDENYYNNFRKNVISQLEIMHNNGVCTFDLKNEFGDRTATKKNHKHIALNKKVKYIKSYSPYYPARKEKTLTDGKKGGWKHGDGRWQGFCQSKNLDIPCFDVIVDLEKVCKIHNISMEFYQAAGAWIYLPKELKIKISNDGISYKELKDISMKKDTNTKQYTKDLGWKGNTKARYIKIEGKSFKPGEWIFLDEIIVK